MASEEKILYNVNKTINGKTISVMKTGSNTLCFDVNMDLIRAKEVADVGSFGTSAYINMFDNNDILNTYTLYEPDGSGEFQELPEHLNGDISSSPDLSFAYDGTTVYAYYYYRQYTQGGLSCKLDEEYITDEQKSCIEGIFNGETEFMNFLYAVGNASSSQVEAIINSYGVNFFMNLWYNYNLVSGAYDFVLENGKEVYIYFDTNYGATIDCLSDPNDRYRVLISTSVDQETMEPYLIITVEPNNEDLPMPLHSTYYWSCKTQEDLYYVVSALIPGEPSQDDFIKKYVDAAKLYIDDVLIENANWAQTNVIPETLYYDMFTFNNITFSKKGNSDEIIASIDVTNGLASDSIIVDGIYLDIVSGEDTYQVDFLGDGSEIPAGGSGTVYGTSSDMELLTIMGVYTITDFQYQAIMPTYTVYYETINVPHGENASYVDPEEVLEGSNPTCPYPDPTNEGYVLGGWYTDTSYTTPFDFDSPIFGDTYVYALWQPAPIILDFGSELWLDRSAMETLSSSVPQEYKDTVYDTSSATSLPPIITFARGENGESLYLSAEDNQEMVILLYDGVSAQELSRKVIGSPEENLTLGILIGEMVEFLSDPLISDYSGDTITFNSVFNMDIHSPDDGSVILTITNSEQNINILNNYTILDYGDYLAANQSIGTFVMENATQQQLSTSFSGGQNYRILTIANGDNNSYIELALDDNLSMKLNFYDGVSTQVLASEDVSGTPQLTMLSLLSVFDWMFDSSTPFYYTGNQINFGAANTITLYDASGSSIGELKNTEKNLYIMTPNENPISLSHGNRILINFYEIASALSLQTTAEEKAGISFATGFSGMVMALVFARSSSGAYIGLGIEDDSYKVAIFDGVSMTTISSTPIASPETDVTLEALIAALNSMAASSLQFYYSGGSANYEFYNDIEIRSFGTSEDTGIVKICRNNNPNVSIYSV